MQGPSRLYFYLHWGGKNLCSLQGAMIWTTELNSMLSPWVSTSTQEISSSLNTLLQNSSRGFSWSHVTPLWTTSPPVELEQIHLAQQVQSCYLYFLQRYHQTHPVGQYHCPLSMRREDRRKPTEKRKGLL